MTIRMEEQNKFVYTTAIEKIRGLTKRKKIIQGGTSAGKTFGILPILIDRAIKEPNLEISVVSESVPHLRRGCLKDFLKIMELTHRFKSEDFNKTHLKYKFHNGSYIEFFSVDDESKLRGARRNIPTEISILISTPLIGFGHTMKFLKKRIQSYSFLPIWIMRR